MQFARPHTLGIFVGPITSLVETDCTSLVEVDRDSVIQEKHINETERSVCVCLSCLFCLHTVDVGISLRSDITLASVFKGAPMA